MGKLRKEYQNYEQRRKLCNMYDLFLADNACVWGVALVVLFVKGSCP